MIPLTAIDLFAGPGGTSLGFRNAGFDIRAAVEADAAAARSYSRNHPEATCLAEDIRDVPPAQILDAADLGASECAAIIGCPPCQGFSTHRLRGMGAADPRNELVEVFAEFVAVIRPAFFVFENVPGLMKHVDSPWAAAKAVLEAKGYRIIEDVLNAADFGVPQRRRRITAIGCRLPEVELLFPQKTHGDPRKGDALPPWRTVRDAIGDLPPLANGERLPIDTLHYAPRHTKESLERFALIPHDGGSRRSLPAHLQLTCHEHHEGHRDVYGRLWWDRPAGTITGGCTQPSKGRFLHPEQDRGLTLREAARLQSFPDSYELEGTKQQIALQIGNAVPAPLAYAIGLAVKAALSQAAQATTQELAVSRI